MENVYLNNLKKSFESIKWYEWIMITVMIAVSCNAVIYGFIEPESTHNPQWLNVINFVSAIAGIICIFFTAKASVSACVFGIINTIVYIVYLWYWHIYGTLCLELCVYLPVSIMQWHIWAKKRDKIQPELTLTKRLSHKQCMAVALSVIVCGIIYYHILMYAGGNVPLLDAFTVSIGVVAVIICMTRYREQYILWLITDVIAVAMYIVMFDPVYLTKKTIYLVMAFVGLYNWYRLSEIRNKGNE